MRHKYLYVFLPIQGNISTNLFPYLFNINFPIVSCPSPRQQPIGNNTWIHMWFYIWSLFLPSKMNIQGSYSNFCPWGRSPLTTVLQACPRKGLQCYSCTLLGGAYISHRTICKPGPIFVFLYQLVARNSPGGCICRLGLRRWCNRNGHYKHLGNFLM